MKISFISFIVVVIISIILPFFHAPSFAVTVNLQWDSNRESDHVTGYKVYYQEESSSVPLLGTGAAEGAAPIDVGNRTTASVSGLDPGNDYYFAVTAYNSLKLESDFSNIVYLPEAIPPTITLKPVVAQTILTMQTIFGTVADNRPGADVSVAVGASAPAAASVTGTSWSFIVDNLEIGDNTITATATDAAGNTAVVPPVTITVYHAGAANVDGTITIADAQKALNYLLGFETPTTIDFVRSDIAPVDMTATPHTPKPNGKLDIDDVLILLRRVVGLSW